MEHRSRIGEKSGSATERHESENSNSVSPDTSSLIPEHIVDHASQRLAVVSIFFAIQAWKIYDILLIKADAYAVSSSLAGSALKSSLLQLNNFTFILKYAFVEGVFLWLLPVLNVPLLSFLPAFTLLLTVVLNAANVLLTSQSAVPLLSGVFVPIWNMVFRQRELTISGDTVLPASVIEPNAHFKGRYTIQYLPESSVALNPFGLAGMCLEDNSSSLASAIKLPIEFNTTNDVGHMQLEWISPSNTRTLLNYTRSDVKRLSKGDFSRYSKYPSYVHDDDRVFYAEVEIKNPGKYKIHRVMDVDGLTIRSYRSEFTIGACPVGKFAYPGPEQSYMKHVCLAKDISLLNWTLPLVHATGVMPLSVEISAFLNEKCISTFNTTLQEPAPTKFGLEWLKEHSIFRNTLEQEALRSQFNLRPGSLRFHVNSIVDGAGISKYYNPASKDKDVNFDLQLKNSPSIRLVDPNPAVPLTHKRSKRLQLVSDLQVTYPLNVIVQHSTTNASLPQNLSFTFRNAEEFKSGIQVSDAGSYQLVSGDEYFCPCQIDAKSTPVQLTKPLPPTVVINENPIKDKCVGTIGYEFDLSFTGNQPFEVYYEVYKNVSNVIKPVLSERGLKQHKRKSQTPNLNFQYLPNQEGNYMLVFKGIKDTYYSDELIPVPEGTEQYSMYISKRSSFSFFRNTHALQKTIRLCKASSAKIPFYLNGNFPFSFRYEVTDANTGKVVESQLVENYTEDTYTVQIPEFKQGGDYKLQVKDVTDSLGCPASCPALEQIKIVARDDVPELSFSDSQEHVIVEGDSVRIPLTLKSSQGFTSNDKITYKVTDLHDEHAIKTFTVPASSELNLKAEGLYTLESFSNSGCFGKIGEKSKQIKVRFHAKPSLVLAPRSDQILSQQDLSFELQSRCQSTPSLLKVKLVGQKPFSLQYVINFPNGRVKNPLVSIDNDELEIPLPSSQSGDYSIKFTNVYDSLYSREKLDRLSHHVQPQQVYYKIRALPEISVDKKYLQICETQVDDESLLKIPVTISGVAPFRIEAHIVHESSDKSEQLIFESVHGNQLSLTNSKASKAFKELLSVGEQLIQLDKIVDANGCERSELGDDSSVKLSVTPIPLIRRLGKGSICVGEHIAYDMTGIAPFKVFYNFNGKHRRAESGAKFVRLALKPGRLSISALQDSSAGLCLVNFTSSPLEQSDLEIEVHEIPSVEISHGDDIIKNLHEGDQTGITFKFTGTPPFLVTYVRTIGDKSTKRHKTQKREKSNRKVVETKTLENIWDYEHTETVSLEGTYDAIMISDANCKAERSIAEILHE
ncbi:hypothetical protein PUMCH_000616 [Australozyma saopauloensis]|uniref:Nucleoporin POM152 n=1 Tax=Australozyma saopauloensis TaxID=291208 RepID=A0AAX4H4D4_9ASCO|nr:hypothetical protein PUMCH_000616 [[Candida] saopauloensis]